MKHSNGRCRATTKAGGACSAPANASGKCFLHEDPARAAEMGRRGGLKNRRVIPDDNVEMPPLNTAADVRAMLAQHAHDVRSRKVEPRVGTALGQLANSLLKAIEVADLEMRLKKLEGKTDGLEEKNSEAGAGTPTSDAN
jgi:hypothetical protein